MHCISFPSSVFPSWLNHHLSQWCLHLISSIFHFYACSVCFFVWNLLTSPSPATLWESYKAEDLTAMRAQGSSELSVSELREMWLKNKCSKAFTNQREMKMEQYHDCVLLVLRDYSLGTTGCGGVHIVCPQFTTFILFMFSLFIISSSDSYTERFVLL